MVGEQTQVQMLCIPWNCSAVIDKLRLDTNLKSEALICRTLCIKETFQHQLFPEPVQFFPSRG
jgi:hypothetical protein